MASPCVLFVDDDADVQKSASLLLERRGFSLLQAHGPDEAWGVLAARRVDVVLLDLNFRPGATSGAEGLALLDALLAHDPKLVVVVVTGHSGITIAVAAMRAGASDFVMKPWNNDRLVATLQDAVRLAGRRRAGGSADAGMPASASGEDGPLVGEDPAILRIRALVARVAPTAAPVLLTGPSGSGKTLLARAIHRLSGRAPDALRTLSPVTLWSQGKAALADAVALASSGATLLLDGLDGLAPPAQAVLQEHLARQPGLRLLSTSRGDRPALLAAGFSTELLYRLNLVEIAIPPLASRPGDPALLAAHFLRMFAGTQGRQELRLSAAALDAIAAAPWLGDVRALRQAIERAVVLANPAVILLEPADVVGSEVLPGQQAGGVDLNLMRSEKAVVEAALKRHGFNVSHAARELGLTRTALYRRMARHRL